MNLNPRGLIALLAVVMAIPAHAEFDMDAVQTSIAQLGKVNTDIRTAPPAQQPALAAKRDVIVQTIRGAGDSNPQNYAAQFQVAKGLSENGQAAAGTVYADRAVDLAEQSGDKHKLGDALTLSAYSYQNAGDYETAYKRAGRAVAMDPHNKPALTIMLATKGRFSSGGTSGQASGTDAQSRTAAPLPRVEAARSGNGRSSFAPAEASIAPQVTFVGGGTQKALKLVGEADRKWSLDRLAAMKLYDEAVAADAKNAAVRAARARARLESQDYAGALEDADASLQGGPSADAHHMRAEALKGLGRKGDEVLAAYKAAADMDGRYAADYQSAVAAFGKEGGLGASAPSQVPAMNAAENAGLRKLWPFGLAAVLGLTAIVYFLFLRHRDEP